MMTKMKQKIVDFMFLLIPIWKNARLLFLYSIFSAAFLTPLSLYLKTTLAQRIIDALTSGSELLYIVYVIIVYTVIQILILLIQLGVAYFYIEPKTAKVKLKINRDIYKKTIETDTSFFDIPEFYDDLKTTEKNFANKAFSAMNIVVGVLGSISTIIVMSTLLLELSPILVILSISYIVVNTIIQSKVNKKNFDKNQELIPVERKFSYLSRVFQSKEMCQDLKCTSVDDYLFSNYDANVDQNLDVIKKYAKSIFVPYVAVCSLGNVVDNGVALIVSAGIYFGAIRGIGAFTTVLNAYTNLVQRINSLFKLYLDFDKNTLYVSKFKSYLYADSTIEDSKKEGKQNLVLPDEPLSVEFRNVHFSYQNSNFRISDFNLKIDAGKTVAIVGSNGAGKSTISKLILRLYDVDCGSIYINGIDIRNIDVSNLRQHIGIAFQKANVYALPLCENLRIYNKQLSDSEIADALNEVSLSDILDKSGGNFDTHLTKEFDKNGIVLSEGEKQKLAIARLVYGKYGIAVFDEPTSALDPISERRIMDIITEKNRNYTAIIVAHRLSTVRNADLIVVMKDGNIAEQGTHDELMKQKGLYHKMFLSQAEYYQL